MTELYEYNAIDMMFFDNVSDDVEVKLMESLPGRVYLVGRPKVKCCFSFELDTQTPSAIVSWFPNDAPEEVTRRRYLNPVATPKTRFMVKPGWGSDILDMMQHRYGVML